MVWTLAATAIASLLGALVYGALAAWLWRRDGHAASRRASRAFAVYWGMTGAYQGLLAAQHALAAGDFAPFPLTLGVRYVGLALATAGIAGLISFFAYLRTGNAAWFRRIGVLYALVGALAWFHIWRSEPVGVALTPWSVDVAYAGDFQGGLFLPLILMLQLAPIVGAVWFLTLVRKTSDPSRRYRIMAVGVGIGLQLLSFLVARLTEAPLWQMVSRTVLGMVVALVVGLAYLDVLAAASPSPHPRDEAPA